ncbi:MAG: hypothetical protein KGV56_02750 [Gammaproteobacteria bacterium]|nr:hypothetical protein [Gammaproteobacteria bacterium]
MNNLIEKYEPVIKKLTQAYKNNEVIDNYDENPVEDIIEFITTIPEVKKDINYDLAIRLYIKDLQCFKWRFVNDKNAGDVWNPLFESFEVFTERTKHNINHWYDDTPYPSEEIIENWIKSNVEKLKKTSKTKPH